MAALPPTFTFLFFATGLAFGSFVATHYPDLAHRVNPMYSAAHQQRFGRLYAYGSIAMLIAGFIVAVVRSFNSS